MEKFLFAITWYIWCFQLFISSKFDKTFFQLTQATNDDLFNLKAFLITYLRNSVP